MESPYSVSVDLGKQLIAAGFTPRSLELNPSVIYILDSSFHIAYCNPAWNAFALQNGGKNLEREIVTGRPYLEVIPDSLLSFYESALTTVFRSQETWEHNYECSSPEKFRLFHMRVLPLSGTHLLLENSRLMEHIHDTKGNAAPADDARYIAGNGLIAMCAHCRRTRVLDSQGQAGWEWVPSYLISTPVPVSHYLCPTCLAYYYKAE